MIRSINNNLRLFLVVLLTLMSVGETLADKTVADLVGEDREMYDKFRHLFKNGKPAEFFPFAEEYSKDLKKKGYMMLYYKLQHNRGFFSVKHNMIYRAIEYAQKLDSEVRNDGAQEYFYLASGLYGEIYRSSHDMTRAEAFFKQALEEVGDRDVKFSMRVFLNLAEMLCLKDSQKALQWADKTIEKAQEAKNVDYLSMALGMKAYIHFVAGDAPQFFRVFDQYVSLRSMDEPEFNNRYDNILEAANLAFNTDFDNALEKVYQGNLAVDSALAVVRIYALKGDLDKGYEAVMRRYVEMDSIYSIIQDANFNQLASETSLMRTREEASANKRLAERLVYWLMGMTAVYLFVYVMGRRRLMKKIWARGKELKAALSRAEESDRMKTAFIQSMSHEIRTPLNAVAGFSQLLCNPDFQLTDKERADMRQRITSNVNQVISIVNEVLELSQSRSEGLSTEIEKSDFSCNDLCRSVLEAMKGRGKDLVEMRFVSNVDDSFMIHTSAYRLRSSLSHLVDNAQKFTEMGSIEMRVERKDSKILFSVTDTGLGIDPQDRERIFEDFSKLDDFKEGIGLGLSLSRRLIESLGGTLELDPVYTGGSRFVITLPIEK